MIVWQCVSICVKLAVTVAVGGVVGSRDSAYRCCTQPHSYYQPNPFIGPHMTLALSSDLLWDPASWASIPEPAEATGVPSLIFRWCPKGNPPDLCQQIRNSLYSFLISAISTIKYYWLIGTICFIQS